MLSVRNPTLQSYKKIYPTNHRAHEWIHRVAQILFFGCTQSTDLWTPWTLLCCVNIKDPVVQERRMHYTTSDFLEVCVTLALGSISGWSLTHTHVNTHAHTVVYTLKWKPQRGCESRLWSRPGELLRSRLVSLALLQDRPQRLVTVRANRTVMGACLSSGFAVITPNEDSPTLLSGVIFDHREHSGVFIK